ncbi:MAG: hypothetical protein COT38_04215 [Candidatus Omnitrophica bacterium CG08_land_8_20_14_0_20_41_16]|nr:MAG: hypothetical protein COT38_04215 [Candidatus Omnitrophica bacterium CG08_land_8_20_14_0_20_41_16]
MSLNTMSNSGTIRACFLFKYTPAKIAIAATGVKFGTCGINLNNIPITIKLIANIFRPPLLFLILMQISFHVKLNLLVDCGNGKWQNLKEF